MGRIYDAKTPSGRDAKTGKPVNNKPCPECGEVGSHSTVRYSRRIPRTRPTRYEIVEKKCPRK